MLPAQLKSIAWLNIRRLSQRLVCAEYLADLLTGYELHDVVRA